MEQISLFDDEFVLLNDAVAAIRAFQPNDAMEVLRSYSDLYPGGQDVGKLIRIASFLKEGLSTMPPSGTDRPSYLFHLTVRLFLRSIVLCDNEPFLGMCKGLDFTDIRREMKVSAPVIFAEYLQRIGRRK